jgi:mRNA-degrading endonuclease RelE of RelBE toxin-antitoxin system
MRFSTTWSGEVETYIKSLAPEPRQAARLALKALAEGASSTDTRALEGRLRGYWRLRVGKHRIIYTITAEAKGPCLNLLFAGPRSTVYGAFETILAKQTRG